MDVMIGKQYLKYFPKEIAQLESGLTLFRSRFKNYDGTNGVISGPHPEFTKTDRMAHFAIDKRYTYSVQKFNEFCAMMKEKPLLGIKELQDCGSDQIQLFAENNCIGCGVESNTSSPKATNLLENIELEGCDSTPIELFPGNNCIESRIFYIKSIC